MYVYTYIYVCSYILYIYIKLIYIYIIKIDKVYILCNVQAGICNHMYLNPVNPFLDDLWFSQARKLKHPNIVRLLSHYRDATWRHGVGRWRRKISKTKSEGMGLVEVYSIYLSCVVRSYPEFSEVFHLSQIDTMESGLVWMSLLHGRCFEVSVFDIETANNTYM